ncbi:MAG: hypothetical protein ACXWNK_02465 [Vulcanimicrobiaceae bacterium]
MTTRKEFLVAGTLAAATPLSAAAQSATPKAAATGPYVFDQDRFNVMLAKDAKHRQCFGCTKIAEGIVLTGMNNSIRAYEEDLREGPGAMHAAAVFYHGKSIVMAMSDTIWDEIVWPSKKITIEDVGAEVWHGKHKGNPFYRSASSDPNDVSIRSLAKHGASFFVCNNALQGMSSLFAQTMKLEYTSAYERLLAGIVPEAFVVPAGVMAINACQEAKFTYIQATL